MLRDILIFVVLVSLTVSALGDNNKRYITYTVNYGEGFNLRRDVYMRVMELILALRKDTNIDWTLVLPPWPRLYHWKTNRVRQNWLPWNRFFDVNELSKIAPCIEFSTYLDMEGSVIDEVLQLQQLEEMFVDGRFVETADERECIDKVTRLESVFGYDDVRVKHSCCVSAQGQVSVMKQFFQQRTTSRSFIIKNFEKLLHDDFGGAQYWRIRKSMVYSPALIKAGNQFMIEQLAYNPRDDNGHPPQGGSYIGAHLRRRDFLYSRKSTVPSLEGVVTQLNVLMQELKLTTVFIASDESTDDEFQKALNSLKGNVYYYTPTSEELQTYGDGGVAIIDQWILSHARYFIGTVDSTFSYRVREERQLLGFTVDSTFNDLCGPSHDESNPHSCPEPIKWLLVNSEDQGVKTEL